MFNYIGYVLILFLIIIFYALFALKIFFEKRSFKKISEKELKKIDITNRLKHLSNEIMLNYEDLSDDSVLFKYLGQAKHILSTDPFITGQFSVCLLKDITNNDFDVKKFVVEYIDAPANIKVLVDTLSDLLGEIYSIRHPFRYRINKFKEKIRMIWRFVFLAVFLLIVVIFMRNSKAKVLESDNKSFVQKPSPISTTSVLVCT